MKRGEVRLLNTETLRPPTVEQTQTVRVQFVLEDNGSRVLAQNSVEVMVIPARLRVAAYKGPVSVITRRSLAAQAARRSSTINPEVIPDLEETSLTQDTTLSQAPAIATQEPALDDTSAGEAQYPALGKLIGKLGYKVTSRLDATTRLAISNYPNAELLEWVREGGKLLYISNGTGPFFWTQSRSGAYSGSWVTSFTWLRENVHRRLKTKNPLGLPFTHAMPRSTILGVPYGNPDYQSDFLSGMVSGWLHHPSIHTVQFCYGRGHVVMTTFAIENGLLRNDPVSTALVHDLVDHLCSDACRPVLRANY